MSNIRELSQLASVISVDDATKNVGIGTTIPVSKLSIGGDLKVSGIVTATSFSGDGSNLSGISSNAFTLNSQQGSYYLDYNNFTNKPFIPSGTSDLTNNAGFVTSGIVVGYATQGYVTNSLVGYATQGYVTQQISNLVDGAPAALDTLNELAAALNDDSSFATTVTNSLSTKISGVGIATAGGIVGTGATILDFRGSGISTVTVASGIATINITGGASVSIGTVAPSSPSAGSLWYNSNLGRIFIYYNDSNSSQWVDAAPFNTNNLVTSDYATLAGIATYASTASTAGIATYSSISGIATYASTAGIATYSSISGIATYASTAGIATTSSNATTAFGLAGTPNITVGNVTGAAATFTNLTVNGTQTIINTTNLEISDPLIGIGSGNATDAQADGDGILIYGGTNKTLTYNNTKKAFEFNIPLATNENRFVTGSEKVTIVNGNTANLVYNSNSSNVAVCTNPTANITLNVTGIPTSSDFDSSSITFTVLSNATAGVAYSCLNVNLNGYASTIKWVSGSSNEAVSGATTTSGYTFYSFSAINTVGSAETTANYTVFGSVSGGFW